jgi:eukaryotic-like serine/threonine-protein kinase
MARQPSRDAQPTDAASAQARCTVCGRRVPSAAAGCLDHGPVAVLEPQIHGGPEVPAEHPDLPGYSVVRVLGRGGFGTVFAAEAEDGGPTVAIKVARRDRVDANLCLLEEAKALRAVGPPHVPAVYGSGLLADGSAYLVLEHFTAETLAERLVRQPAPIPLPEIAAVADAMLVTLAAVHARGLIHGDLKPENVFLDGDQRWAKLIDFGLVTESDEASTRTTATTERPAAGTAEYMAPEQCEGRPGEGAGADLYAMGIILYELIAGRPPFWGPRALVQQHHRARRPVRLGAQRSISAALESAVMRCLAKDPKDRFESAGELRTALAAAFAKGSRPPLPQPSEASDRKPPNASRERRRVGLVFFESDADALAIQRRIVSLGGQLAHASGERYVAIHGHEGGENPARRALQIAQELIDRDLCKRALVDLAPVLVQTRPDGSRRVLSALFSRDGRFPTSVDPPGVFLMRGAAPFLADVPAVPLLDERGWVRIEGAEPVPSVRGGAPDATATALVGRDDLVTGLLAGAHRAVTGNVPSIIGVVAEAGYGKSHLAAELAERLRAQKLPGTLIELRGREPAFGGVDPTLKALLCQALGLPASMPLDGGREILSAHLGARGSELWATIALALDWIAPESTELRARAAAPRALRSAMIRTVGEALRRAAPGPFLVLLDDAHLADDVLLAALEHAALAEAGAPIWVCALGRPSFEIDHPTWGERAAHREMHHLGALDPEGAATLCRQLLRPVIDIPEAVVRRIVERAQAIPLLLVEIVRDVRRHGHVRRHPKGDGWFLVTDGIDRLPDLPILEWLAETELDALAPTLRAHARLIALLGADVTVPEVEGVLLRLELAGHAADLSLDARTGIRRLLSAGVLTPQRDARVRFRHALTREAVARSAPASLQRLVHLFAFEYYRAATALAEEHRMTQLAAHAAGAGRRGDAAAAYLELAERARARHAYLDAELLYNRAIDQSNAPSREAYRGRALMRYRLERYQDALADFALARAAASAAGDAAIEMEILLDEATALDWMDEYTSSEKRVEQARGLSAATPVSTAIEARLLLGIGRSHHRFSREAEAAEALERAVALAERLGDAAYETHVISLMILGFIYPVQNRLEDARLAIDRTVQLCEQHGDLLHLVGAINNRAMFLAYLGDRAGMHADFVRVLSLARELGHRTPELFAHYNLAEYLTLMDHVDAAEPHVERALAIEERRAGDAVRPVVVLLAARIELHRGDEAAARRILERIRAHQIDARAANRIDTLLAPSEDVLASMVDLATRDASPPEWTELEARSARLSVGQEQIEVLEARALAAFRRGRFAEARLQLDRALAAASRIPNVMGARLRRETAEIEAMKAPTTPPSR